MPEQITKDVYKIHGEGNVYVILNPEPFLIDASDNSDSKHILEEIKKVIDPEKIKTVLLTHLHYDHCGNIDLFPNAQVYVPEVELENFKQTPDDFFIQGISQESRKMLENAKILPSEINGLEVVKVPGHTRGSVTFLDKKRKLIFSGDTLFDNGIGRTDFANSLPGVMDDSVQKIQNLIEELGLTLCPGHDY
ncbi:MBL fold metallo-hydrolase [archaeon]|nr:MBL fold metallo-hydrolase [archaeon]